MDIIQALSRWVIRMVVILPVVMIFARAGIFFWQGVDSVYYLVGANLVRDWILMPLHPFTVWLVKYWIPAFEIFASNNAPGADDAPRLFHPLAMATFAMLIWWVWSSLIPSDTGRHDARYWRNWALMRAAIFPFAFVFAHVGVLIWQATDPNYRYWADAVVLHILQPLHPITVWVVGEIFPMGKTLVMNRPPSSKDAASMVFYPAIMALVYASAMGLKKAWDRYREVSEISIVPPFDPAALDASRRRAPAPRPMPPGSGRAPGMPPRSLRERLDAAARERNGGS